MKRILAILLFTSLIIPGCNMLDKLTQFEIEYNETIVIPATLGIDTPVNVQTPDIETNSASSFEVNDTRKDLIESIILTQMDMTITSPSDETFSFLESIAVYISADSLDEIEIAWNEDISDSIGDTLDLETTDVDLKEYIKKDSFNLRVKTVIDEVIDSTCSIDLHTVFFVDAEILGI